MTAGGVRHDDHHRMSKASMRPAIFMTGRQNGGVDVTPVAGGFNEAGHFHDRKARKK